MGHYKKFIKDAYEGEKWRNVLGYEGYYEISDAGRVRTIERDVTHSRNNKFKRKVRSRILKQSLNQQGYFKVRLSKKGKQKTKLIHHLVAESFLNHIKRSNSICVDHIDENTKNNRLENLQIISKRHNTAKSFDNKLTLFKNNKWWYHNNGTLLQIIEVSKKHGITLKCLPVYRCLTKNKFSFHNQNVLSHQATKEEVENSLINEAKRRGFNYCNYRFDVDNNMLLGTNACLYDYSIEFDILMENGKWKEKQKKKLTLKEIEKELGYEIEIVSD